MGGKPRCSVCLEEAAVTIHEADAEHPDHWHWVHYCARHDPEATAHVHPEAGPASKI